MNSERLKLRNIEKSHEFFLLILDALLLLVLLVNLTLIVFDTLFVSEVFQNALSKISDDFVNSYRVNIHANFPTYDMIFVAIFLTEFFFRWAVAAYRHTYHRWFFYPIIHWYDLLGCIPVGSMRWLRLLRVFSVFYRLHKYKIVDFSKTYAFQTLLKYFRILTEEVSDRVVVNVLDSVQKEIKSGNPVVARITKEVLIPQRTLISHVVTQRINEVHKKVYVPRRESLKSYVDKTINESLNEAPKLKLLEKVPLAGPLLNEILYETVSVVVFNVVDKIYEDLGSKDSDLLVQDLTNHILEQVTLPSQGLNEASQEVILQAIDIIKEEVSVQQWKTSEL